MKTASNSIIDTLKERGYRITAPRRAIVEALVTASTPKTVKEIGVHTKIKDLSTVYRTLGELVKESLAEEFTDKGTSYFELGGHHHDHAVCTGCGAIAHVPCSETKIPASLKKAGWVVETHEALWRGRCKACV
ncbi:MAG: ferric uptake regulator, Fur family [Candidatus Parcubacteria bacterium]|jgi:Fur family ferric uptake transcriptional regulator